MNEPERPAVVRLRPEMVSLRLHVLGFVRRYIGRFKYSPSQGEIAAACSTNRTRVKDALKSLAEEGLLLRSPGPRGLKMPSERDAALRVLKALGWSVDEAERHVAPPGPNGAASVPNFTLPPAATPAYPKRRRRGGRGSRGERTNGGKTDVAAGAG